jgi:glycerone phosphate O-acyltransferase
MLGTQFYATKAMSELRFHNTYTFSKCICEHLLMQRNDPNTLIIRPSIVGPAVETPFEAWSGEKPSTIVAGACLHLSHQWNIWYLEPRPVAYIPVDVLSQFVLARLFEERKKNSSLSCDGASSSENSFEQINRVSDTSSDSEQSTSTISTSTNDSRRHLIFNATWDTASNNNAVFSWLEFSVAYLHLGCVLGYFKRSTAYLALLIDAQLMPNLAPTNSFYDRLHSLFIRGPVETMMSLCDLMGYSTHEFSKLLSFLDLPLLFFPFVKNSFHFQSDLVAPECFDAKRYVFSCGVAAHRFLSTILSKKYDSVSESSRRAIVGIQQKMTMFIVGGSAHHVGSSDFWWAFSQPRGGYLIRFVAFLFIKILRAVCSVVTVDATSFRSILSSLKSQENRRVFLVLAPTHRSFFDFILLSYVFFSLPELQIDIPFIVAADEFEQLPVIGWLARFLRAFYIQRGRGYEDTSLTTSLASMKENNMATIGASLEVFLEGKRSRDRRFVDPKTGFLKSLKQSGGEHVVIPITINYEELPEQRSMSEEAAGTNRRGLKISGMLEWLKVRVVFVFVTR